MSKSEKKVESKPEARKPSAEHASRLRAARLAATEAHARVGVGYIELMQLAQAAANAAAQAQEVLNKAGMSVGIDPTGDERWAFDDITGAFTKQ